MQRDPGKYRIIDNHVLNNKGLPMPNSRIDAVLRYLVRYESGLAKRDSRGMPRTPPGTYYIRKQI